jgi:hypothetical protein
MPEPQWHPGSEAIMFNLTEIVIQAASSKYVRPIYGILERANPDIIGFVPRLSLENIADSDAAYHSPSW